MLMRHELRSRRSGRRAITLLTIGLFAVALAGQMGRFIPWLDPVNALAPIVCLGALVLTIPALQFGRIAGCTALLALLCSAERVVPTWANSGRDSIALQGHGIVVLSFNAWRHQDRPTETLRTLIASGADIILLQEAGHLLRVKTENLDGVYPYRSDCPDDCDLAILSRIPVREFRYRARDGNGNAVGPRIVFADLVASAGRREMTVATIHFDRRLHGISNRSDLPASLKSMFAIVNKNDLVIGGDFNMTPYSFAYDDTTRAMQPIRRVSVGNASFPALVAGYEWVPAFAIDHIFAAPRWSAQPFPVETPIRSDHKPVAVRLFERSAFSS